MPELRCHRAGYPLHGVDQEPAAAEREPSISLSDCENNNAAADSNYCQGEAESNDSLSDPSDGDNFLGHGGWGR